MSSLSTLQLRKAMDLPPAGRQRIANLLEDLLSSAAPVGYTCEIRIGAGATQFDWRQPTLNDDGGWEPVSGPLRARMAPGPAAPVRRYG